MINLSPDSSSRPDAVAPPDVAEVEVAAGHEGPRGDGGTGEIRTGILEDSLGYALKCAQVRCEKALVSVLPAELSPTRMTALSLIDANPGITQSVLGVALQIAPPSVVKVVDMLERLALVQRQASAVDRRVYILALTDLGRAELERCRLIVEDLERDFRSGLSQAERALLIELLGKVGV